MKEIIFVHPYLKFILMNTTDKANLMLCAKSMECISLVGMVIGKYKFKDDAKQLIETITAANKRIWIKSSVLKEKATTYNMLCCYADELNEGLFPWINQGVSNEEDMQYHEGNEEG
uniref:Uncharacterized protein n=1 Tax=Lactuca sativa TaxID=4236 RepID=A0A9R1XIF9_LACSA|nr:hypothetical protein LSAT_V11C400190460 [Lactuca sativa]